MKFLVGGNLILLNFQSDNKAKVSAMKLCWINQGIVLQKKSEIKEQIKIYDDR